VIIDCLFHVRCDDWPLRRRGILFLLDNPRLPSYVMPSVKTMAFQLADRLEQVGHPNCAYAIRLRLSGVRVWTDGYIVKVLEND